MNLVPWWLNPRYSPELLVHLHRWIDDADARSAAAQLHHHYRMGGWQPFEGFSYDKQTNALRFPGDPPLFPIGGTFLRDETILLYPHDWVLVLQPDGSFEVARLD